MSKDLGHSSVPFYHSIPLIVHSLKFVSLLCRNILCYNVCVMYVYMARFYLEFRSHGHWLFVCDYCSEFGSKYANLRKGLYSI